MSMTPVFNPSIIPYPSELDDVIPEHQLNDETIKSLRAINDVVLVDEENDSMVVKEGGFTFQVVSMSLKQIADSEPAIITLKVIEIFHLDSYLRIDDEMEELEAKAIEAGHRPPLTSKALAG